jgi:hypothetical protein
MGNYLFTYGGQLCSTLLCSHSFIEQPDRVTWEIKDFKSSQRRRNPSMILAFLGWGKGFWYSTDHPAGGAAAMPSSFLFLIRVVQTIWSLSLASFTFRVTTFLVYIASRSS